MNFGKIAAGGLVISAVLAGFGLWYAQEYGYYYSIESQDAHLELATSAGQIALDITDFQGIDANSSPLRWRACARVSPSQMQSLQPVPFADAAPLFGPKWFSCFDAKQIGADLEQGRAQAVLSVSDIHPDVDRIMALYPDGRIFGRHQYLDKTPERGVMD